MDISMASACSSTGEKMYGRQIVDNIMNRANIMGIIVKDKQYTLAFPNFGDGYSRILLQNTIDLTVLNGTKGQYQKATVIFQQPVNGNCEVNFPDTILWADKKPFIDTRGGKTAIIEFIFDGSDSIYGRMIYG